MTNPDEILGNILEGAGKELTSKLVSALKALIKENRYGFTTSDKVAKELQNIGQRGDFLRLKECVGHHWALNLIRIGLYIAELNNEGQRQLIDELKSEVFRKHGEYGIRVLDIGSTRTTSEIIAYLSKLKLEQNLKEKDLSDALDELIKNWRRITVFVKAEDSYQSTYTEILRHIDLLQPTFFVFAYGSARNIVIRAIAALNNDKKIYQKGYLFFTSNSKDLGGFDVFSCNFRLC